MKFKKIVLLILILSLTLSISACKKSEEEITAVTVGNASVDKAIFTYYLDAQIPADGKVESKDDAISEAEKLCAHYVFVNTEFEKRGLILSSGEKNSVATSVDDIWNIYGTYYENIGVTKEDITLIKTCEAKEASLITAIYGSGGDKEISEEELKNYFNENYIFFKEINTYLSGTEDENAAIKKTFEGLEDEIDEDTTIDKVNVEYVESIGGTASDTLQVSYMKKGSDVYPEAFFEAVKALDNNETEVLVYDDYIFLVQKCNSDDYFADYKSTILSHLTTEILTTYLTDAYKDQTVSGVSSIEKDCFNTIKSEKSK